MVALTADRRQELADRGMLLGWWAQQQPDTVAVSAPSGSLTFAELNRDANALARGLRRRGLQAGDALALICGNSPEFAVVVAAGQRAGLRLTPINWHLTAEEARYIVDDCEARALIGDAMFSALVSGAATTASAVRIAVGGSIEGFEAWADVVGSEDGSDVSDPVIGTQMLYTSGTTGRPKGVHRPPAGAVPLANIYGYREGGQDRHLCTGPLYHAAPLAFSLSIPLAFGASVVLMERWDAAEALRLIGEHRITHTHVVPTMFHRLLSLPEDVRAGGDTSSLRHVLHGAAPCPVSIKHRVIEWLGPIVWEYYAATEGVGSFVDSATWLAHPGTVGKPLVEGQVRIGDEKGEPLPPGQVGLVHLRAPAGARFDYFNDADKTADSYRGDYFTLGDVGYLDAEGYLYLTDRSANLIISGGVNIYPAEVDAALLEHPAVGDAATIGVPDQEWGETVRAVVELQPGLRPSSALAEELMGHCRDRLAAYKCPRAVDFVDELPRQDNGKIYKRLLRDRYRAQSGSARS